MMDPVGTLESGGRRVKVAEFTARVDDLAGRVTAADRCGM